MKKKRFPSLVELQTVGLKKNDNAELFLSRFTTTDSTTKPFLDIPERFRAEIFPVASYFKIQ